MDPQVVSTLREKLKTAKVSLPELFKELGLTAPPALARLVTDHVDDIVVEIDDGWSVEAKLAASPPWTLAAGALGPLRPTFRDVSLKARRKASGSSVTFTGVMDLGRGVTLDMSCTFPGEIEFTGRFGTVGIADLFKCFRSSIDFPAALDLRFTGSEATLRKSGDVYTLEASATIENIGACSLEASRESGTWGLQIEGTGGGDPFAIPGLDVLRPLAAAAGIEEPRIVVTTRKEPFFRLESRLSGDGMLIPLRVLIDFIGIHISDDTPMTMEIHSKFDRCRVTVPFDAPGIGLEGVLGLTFAKSQPAVMLAGTLSTAFGDFRVGATGTTTGVMISGSAVDPNATVSIGIGTLRNLGVTLGVNGGGVPSFGFFGTFDSSRFEMSVAFFANSVDPSKSMVAASLDSVTLADVVRTVTRVQSFPGDFLIIPLLEKIAFRAIRSFDAGATLANALDANDVETVARLLQKKLSIAEPSDLRVFVNEKGKRWHFAHLASDVRHYSVTRKGKGVQVDEQGQLYFAPQDTSIGGVAFRQGMRLAADIELLSFRASITAELELGRGIRAEGRFAPIAIGNADFLELTSAESRKEGPVVSIATYPDPSAPPGRQHEHVLISGRLHLLGTDFASAQVYSDAANAILAFQAELAPLIHVAVNVVVQDRSLASVSGNGTVTFPSLVLTFGTFGSPVSVSIQINGTSTSGTSVSGRFSFPYPDPRSGGMSSAVISFPPIPLLVPLTELHSVLPGPMSDAIARRLGVDGYVKLVEKGLIVPGPAKDLAGILMRQFGRNLAQTTKILHDLGKTGSEVAAALQQFTSDPKEALRVLLSAGYHLTDVALSMQKLFSASPELVVEVANFVAGGVTNLGVEGAKQIAEVLNKVYHLDGAEVVSVFKKVGWGAMEVGRVFRDAGKGAEEIATVLHKGFAWTAEQTADFLKNGLNVARDGVDSALRAAGYTAAQVGNAVARFFTSTLNPTHW